MGHTQITERAKQLVLSMILMGAASVSHAITLTGSTVSFTFNETSLGLFSGAYAVSGDTLTFTPTSFVNSGDILVSQTINVLVTPKPGWQFSSIGFQESGLYSQNLFIDDVAVGGQLRIFDPAQAATELTPAIVNPVFLLPATNQPWNTSISQSLALFTSASSLNVTIENILIAYPGAEISKDLASLTVLTTPVPEVETWAMMVAGLGLIGLQLRRRTGGSTRVIH